MESSIHAFRLVLLSLTLAAEVSQTFNPSLRNAGVMVTD